jgi:thioesterase domain-containing protein
MTANELTKKIHKGIPLTQAMAFDITQLTETSITVKTGGEENINVHGTAFAGSLYTTCVLAAWGLVNSRLPDEASLVLASGQ